MLAVQSCAAMFLGLCVSMLCFRGSRLRFRHSRLSARLRVVIGVFLAVDRTDVRGIAIEIRSADSKILSAGVDPLPELLGGNPSLRACRTLHAHDVGGEPVTIAAAQTSAVIGAIVSSFLAA